MVDSFGSGWVYCRIASLSTSILLTKNNRQPKAQLQAKTSLYSTLDLLVTSASTTIKIHAPACKLLQLRLRNL
jgi:hypothetical protein